MAGRILHMFNTRQDISYVVHCKKKKQHPGMTHYTHIHHQSYVWFLVGGFNPSEKWWSSSVGVTIPNIWRVIKFMFQTANQISPSYSHWLLVYSLLTTINHYIPIIYPTIISDIILISFFKVISGENHHHGQPRSTRQFSSIFITRPGKNTISDIEAMAQSK